MEHLSWQAHEYHHTEKTSDWYWIVGIVTVSLALICIIYNNIILGILILVSSFLALLLMLQICWPINSIRVLPPKR